MLRVFCSCRGLKEYFKQKSENFEHFPSTSNMCLWLVFPFDTEKGISWKWLLCIVYNLQCTLYNWYLYSLKPQGAGRTSAFHTRIAIKQTLWYSPVSRNLGNMRLWLRQMSTDFYHTSICIGVSKLGSFTYYVYTKNTGHWKGHS